MTENGSDTGTRQLERHLAENPQSERFTELAAAWVAEGRLAEAVRLCETSLGFYPSMPAGHMIYAKALVAMGRLEEGIQAFERACALRTNDAGIHAEAGHCLADFGYHQAAIPYLQTATRLSHDDPRVISLGERLERVLGADFERIETGRLQLEAIWSRAGGPRHERAGKSEPEIEANIASDELEHVSLASEDEEEGEPPTVYEINPLALQEAKDQAVPSQPTEPAEPVEAARQAEDALEQTQYDPVAGLRAGVTHAVDELVDRRETEPPTWFDSGKDDRAIAQPERNEPPTVYQVEQPGAASREPGFPAQRGGRGGQPARHLEPPTRAVEPRAEAARPGSPRPQSASLADLEAAAATEATISYWKVFLVVVPFLFAAVSGGLFFGYRHLRNERISSLLEQSLGALSQDTFAGYSDARTTLLKLLELEEHHERGRALLALVTARLHDEFGPNLAMRDTAKSLVTELEPTEETEVDLLWARFHAAQGLGDSDLKTDLDGRLRNEPKNARLMALAGELAIRRGELEKGYQWLQASQAESLSNVRTLATIAELEVNTERVKQASQHLVRALAINPIHVRSLILLSRLRVQRREELESAKRDLEKALELPQVTDRDRSRAYQLYAQLSFLSGERPRALSALKAASQLMPDDVAFLRELAELCLRYYELDEASALGKRLLELIPDDVASRLFLIRADLPRVQGKKALVELNKLVGKKVPAAPFLALRGEALLSQRRYAAALADLRAVPADSAQRPRAWALEVLAWIGQGDIERARRESLALQRKHPSYALTQYAVGTYRLARGLRRGAAAAFRKAIQLDPSCYQAHEQLARMALAAGQDAEAQRVLLGALAANPYAVQAHFLLGQVRLRSSDPQAALDSFVRVVKESPDHGAALACMAEALLDLGRLNKAVVAIRKGRKAGADDAHARHVEGRVYLANGRFHTAVRALSAADALHKRDPEILADLGLALLGVRSIQRAEKAFQDSLRNSRRNKRLPRAQEGLARVLFVKHKWYDSARAFEKAAQYARRGKRPAFEVTRLYLQAGRTMLKDTKAGNKRYAQARRLFQRGAAVASAADKPEPFYEVAATFDREDKIQAARRTYQKVLALAPQHAKTLYRLGLLEFDDGNDERAKELLTRFLQIQPTGKLAKRARKVLKRAQ